MSNGRCGARSLRRYAALSEMTVRGRPPIRYQGRASLRPASRGITARSAGPNKFRSPGRRTGAVTLNSLRPPLFWCSQRPKRLTLDKPPQSSRIGSSYLCAEHGALAGREKSSNTWRYAELPPYPRSLPKRALAILSNKAKRMALPGFVWVAPKSLMTGTLPDRGQASRNGRESRCDIG